MRFQGREPSQLIGAPAGIRTPNQPIMSLATEFFCVPLSSMNADIPAFDGVLDFLGAVDIYEFGSVGTQLAHTCDGGRKH